LISCLPEKEQQAIVSMALVNANNMKENITVISNNMTRDRVNIRKHEQVLNQKFTLSVACILFFFIGAPLGAIIRKGGLGMPVVVSVVFFVIYYVITIIGERVAVNGDMSVFLGAWISSIVLFPIGIFLTFKATTDAAILDAESWKKFFTKRKKSNTI
jgi:lipopolysaccharide export system permease protein